MKTKPTGVLMVEVSITEDAPGLFTATSRELPELMLSHESVDILLRELPKVIEGVARWKYKNAFHASPMEGIDSIDTYMRGNRPYTRRMPWVLIPPLGHREE